jgi:hypothetical protein
MILPLLRNNINRAIGIEKAKIKATRNVINILIGAVSFLKANRVNIIRVKEGGTNNVDIILAVRCFMQE